MSDARVAFRWEVIDHHIDHPSYFQGCGVALTEFADAATGTGNSPQEAFDDALEQLASGGWCLDLVTDKLSDESALSEEPEGYDGESSWHYVSVRVREFSIDVDETEDAWIPLAIQRLASLDLEIHGGQCGDTLSAPQAAVRRERQLDELRRVRDRLLTYLAAKNVTRTTGWLHELKT